MRNYLGDVQTKTLAEDLIEFEGKSWVYPDCSFQFGNIKIDSQDCLTLKIIRNNPNKAYDGITGISCILTQEQFVELYDWLIGQNFYNNGVNDINMVESTSNMLRGFGVNISKFTRNISDINVIREI